MQRSTILASLAPLALAGCSSAAETEASAAQAAAINATDVVAYSDGSSQAFATGTFRANQGQLDGVGNDAIRSLQVPDESLGGN